ncbi:MAG: phenylacetate--CoA ligase family protein [Planctomycetota bacterium]
MTGSLRKEREKPARCGASLAVRELTSVLPIVAGRVIYPLHERLLRRPTFAFARELERSQWLSPNDIRALQRRKLRALLRHARDNVPFYRRRFDDAGIDRDGDDPLEILRRLPLLDKTEIRASLGDMLWHQAPGGLFQTSTGGSTGEPLILYVDRRRQACDQAARIRSHRWFGARPGDRELYLWGSPIEKQRSEGVKRLRDALFNQRLLDAFNMSPERMDAYLDEWDRFQPVSLFGYPSSIVLLVDHARSRGRRLDTRCLRAVFVTGEVCCPRDREKIAAYFEVPVADGYGSRDAGFIAHECPEGRLHVTAENVLVEIVDDHRPVASGGQTSRPRVRRRDQDGSVREGPCGEIVITHLDAYAMPLIRYRTGDMGRLLPGRCSCGRGLPLMDVVQGRTTDFLYLPDGNTRHALSIIYPLRETPGVSRFRVVQHDDYSVVIEVVCDDRIARVTPEAVARRVRPVIGEHVPLDVRLVERIDPMASGKHRYVISHARPAIRGGQQQENVRA